MSERPHPHALRLNAGRVRQAERNIAWILEHPAFSDWLKDALRSGVMRDPVHLTNDLELLRHLLCVVRCTHRTGPARRGGLTAWRGRVARGMDLGQASTAG